MRGMITREELASRLSVSVSEIRRRESRGQIKASAKEGKKSLFNETLVSTLAPFVGKGRLQSIAAIGIEYRKMYKYRSEDSQKVFERLKKGQPIEDIIIELCLHPGIVRAIAEEFKDITGAVLVLGDTMAKINDLDLDGNFPLTTGEDILDVIQKAASNFCERCHKRPGTICTRCVVAEAEDREE